MFIKRHQNKPKLLDEIMVAAHGYCLFSFYYIFILNLHTKWQLFNRYIGIRKTPMS